MNMETIIAAIEVVLMWTGTFFIVVGGIGLLRLPDVLSRCHAVAKGSTLGICLILLAVWMELGTQEAGLKILVAIAFQWLTIPVAGHILSRSVYYHQIRPRSEEQTPNAVGR
jgi:multicomponent Na+:H+ antiporter subunit G